MNIVLMICAIGCANRRDRAWAGVVQIGGRRVILEWLVMGDVIHLFGTGHSRSVSPVASGAAIRIGDREIKSALKEAPGYAFGIQ